MDYGRLYGLDRVATKEVELVVSAQGEKEGSVEVKKNDREKE